MSEPDRDRYRAEVIRQICDIKRIEADEFDLGDRFVEDLGFDSLDLFELVANLEEAFEVPIPDEALVDVRTVQDAVDVVDRMVIEAQRGGAEDAGEAAEPAAVEATTDESETEEATTDESGEPAPDEPAPGPAG